MFLLISDYACIDEGGAFPVAGNRGNSFLRIWNSESVLCERVLSTSNEDMAADTAKRGVNLAL